MLYFVIAHSAEAQPIIQHFLLKRVYKFAYTMFENNHVKLIISGMGIENALMATSVLLGYSIPTQSGLLINIGICAAPDEIGTILLIHKISHKNRSYFPDILFKHNLQESSLETVSKPHDTTLNYAIDMEAYGVYQAASRFFKTHQMVFLKIVSDNFKPDTITKETTKELISSKLTMIDVIVKQAMGICKEDDIFADEEIQLINSISNELTKAQNDNFLNACRYYKLHYKKSLLHCNINIPTKKLTKQQRNVYFNELIQALTC